MLGKLWQNKQAIDATERSRTANRHIKFQFFANNKRNKTTEKSNE